MNEIRDSDRREGFPDRRKGSLEALEKHVDDHIKKIEGRLSKWLFRGLIAYAVIALACVGALIGFEVVIDQIQATRKEFIRTTCEAQNKRNANTIKKFRKASNEAIKRNPKFAKEIRKGRKDNEAIINALAPKQDCKKLSAVAVGEKKPPPPTITSRKNP